MSTLQAAHDWLDKGISVLPIGYRSKVPDFGALKRTGFLADDGRPSWDRLKAELPTASTLRMWFGAERQNLGVITGWQGLVVIDFDNLAAYQCWRQWLAVTGKRLSTYEVMTGRGVHVYLFADMPAVAAHVGDVDIKASGGYVLAPPSVHPSRRVYIGNDRQIAKVESINDVFPPIAESPTSAQEPAPYDPYAVACQAQEPLADAPLGAGAVAAIKAAFTMIDLLPEIASAQRSTHVMVRCPLHDDHNPSMAIYPDGRWYCHGCRRGGGDQIDLFAAMHNLDLRQAIAELYKRVRG